MDWTNKIDLIIAAASAISAKEIVVWLIRRYKNKGEISATAARIKAETKSIEVQTLSGLVERLDAKIIFLESKLEKTEKRERDCLERSMEQDRVIADLQSQMQLLNFNPPNYRS